MNNKKIKVIKKKDLHAEKHSGIPKKPDAKESAKALVSNVSSWVNDFQKRNREETKKAFESLFTSHPERASS